MFFLESKTIRILDTVAIDSGISGIKLMERAGYGAFRFITKVAAQNAKRILIVAGKGNNAGDAFVVARYLLEANLKPTILLLTPSSEFSGDAKTNLEQLNVSKISDFEKVTDFFNLWHGDLIIDGILGTGIKGEVTGIFAETIKCINQHRSKVISLDIPSGLNCDTGEKCGIAVKANWTATFAHPKLAMLTESGAKHCGRVEIIDIGIPYVSEISDFKNGAISSFSSTEIVDCFPQKKATDHKNKFGHLLIIAGSKGMTGAAILCAQAAAESGAGLRTIAVPESILGMVTQSIPSCITLPVSDSGTGFFTNDAAKEIKKSLSKFNAIAIGPGLGKNKNTESFLNELLPEINIPVVIDADALNIISTNEKLLKILSKKEVVITPHPGEFSNLTKCKKTSLDTEERINATQSFSEKFKITTLLKGKQTVICSPGEFPCVNMTGNVGMATAGSGDVLTGIIGSFLAQGFSQSKAAISGAFIHGLAGDIASCKFGTISVNAEKIIESISEAFLYCE